MALHPNFPDDPHAILDPAIRWFPADEALRSTSFEKLLPPLVPTLRKEVKAWRDSGYDGAAETSKSLLRWWFAEQHLLPKVDGSLEEFCYYFAHREALETIVYLYDVVGVKDKYDLMRFDGSGTVSTGMFDETWRRFVVKMATGAGKTKVLSLVLPWSFFHKLYEPDSTLARNFLVIAPNIIVSVFNRIIGDSGFELEFAAFLDGCEDEIVSYAKNYFAVGFKLDYVNADGDISNYYPDFFVKVSDKQIYIVEAKGREDLDGPLKMARLKQWCDDINQAQNAVQYDFVFVDEEGFKKYRPDSFAALVKSFREYRE